MSIEVCFIIHIQKLIFEQNIVFCSMYYIYKNSLTLKKNRLKIDLITAFAGLVPYTRPKVSNCMRIICLNYYSCNRQVVTAGAI